MATAIKAAKLHVEMALRALDRSPRDRWARERYEFALRALEGIEADEIAQAQAAKRGVFSVEPRDAA
jgi:hypothetical protein